MLADVRMVKTYSKSAHVNDLGFAWTSPPCCMDRLPPPPPLHGPALLLFLEETFYTLFALMVSSSQGKERFVLPSIGETTKKNTRFQFLMRYHLISMHCITCYMSLDCLSCCKCLLVHVTFYHTHWSVDGPRSACSKSTHRTSKYQKLSWGACPQPPSLRYVIYGLTGFYPGATALLIGHY